ncbi:MAG: hypothetical protein AB2822_09670 [Candidatus Thiodiazotropha endolucinida]
MDSDSFWAGIMFAVLVVVFLVLGIVVGAEGVKHDCEYIGRILIDEEVYSCTKESLN